MLTVSVAPTSVNRIDGTACGNLRPWRRCGRLTLRTGLLPVEVVLGHPGYVHGWARATPRPRELFLAGTELVRTADGWRARLLRTCRR